MTSRRDQSLGFREVEEVEARTRDLETTHLRRRLAELVSDEAFACLAGSTDSEHAFSLLWDFYRERSGYSPLARLEMRIAFPHPRLELTG